VIELQPTRNSEEALNVSTYVNATTT